MTRKLLVAPALLASRTVTEERRFCRFLAMPPEGSAVYTNVPEGGLCLNVFLLLAEPGHPERILLGRLDPSAHWERIGALDAARVGAHQNGWMIPSCHLLHLESPAEAAQRIAREQLELPSVPLGEPLVASESYPRLAGSPGPLHWDLSFLFRGEWPEGKPVRAAPWKALRFVDVARSSRAEIARSHADVLAFAGLRTRD